MRLYENLFQNTVHVYFNPVSIGTLCETIFAVYNFVQTWQVQDNLQLKCDWKLIAIMRAITTCSLKHRAQLMEDHLQRIVLHWHKNPKRCKTHIIFLNSFWLTLCSGRQWICHWRIVGVAGAIQYSAIQNHRASFTLVPLSLMSRRATCCLVCLFQTQFLCPRLDFKFDVKLQSNSKSWSDSKMNSQSHGDSELQGPKPWSTPNSDFSLHFQTQPQVHTQALMEVQDSNSNPDLSATHELLLWLRRREWWCS